MEKQLNGLDLFAGIGGFSLGIRGALERVGIDYRTLCYVENDLPCQQILKSRMLDGVYTFGNIYGDIREFDGKEWRGKIDIITGGFPCQDISLAGNRAGIKGERSGLFFEIWRVVREVRPAIVIMENVPAITSTGYGEITREISASGYHVQWNNLSAAAVGAPHQRNRWFAIAYSNCAWKQQSEGIQQKERGRSINSSEKISNSDSSRQQKGKSFRGNGNVSDTHSARSGCRRSIKKSGNERRKTGKIRGKSLQPENRKTHTDYIKSIRENVSNSNGIRCNSGGEDSAAKQKKISKSDSRIEKNTHTHSPGREKFNSTTKSKSEGFNSGLSNSARAFWSAEPLVGRVVDGFSGRNDRIRALGNAVVPQVVAEVVRRILIDGE